MVQFLHGRLRGSDLRRRHRRCPLRAYQPGRAGPLYEKRGAPPQTRRPLRRGCLRTHVTRFQNHQSVSAQQVDLDYVMLDVSRHHPVNQRIESTHVVITPGGPKLYPVSVRYAWPAEIDAMALGPRFSRRARRSPYPCHRDRKGQGPAASRQPATRVLPGAPGALSGHHGSGIEWPRLR